jgi:hypothetical protein
VATKQRSPNYPGLDLGQALEALKQLYPKVLRGEFTPKDAAAPWGYTSPSGPVRRKFGALRQYGLLEQRKGDNAKLTPRALTLVLRNPASAEYQAARREAALEPGLIRELFESGKHDAADDALRQDLIVHRGFTDEGADRFIEVLRATLALAGLTDSANIAGQEEDNSSQPNDGVGDMDTPPPAPNKFVLSLVGGPASLRFELPLPLTEAQWKQLTGMLDAVKPALVGTAAEAVKLQQAEGRRELGTAPLPNGRAPSALTAEAQDLLVKVDDGGVPAYMTGNLERIAKENGVSVSPDTAPNEIIEELRRRA